MSSNLQMEGTNHRGSEQASTSDCGQLVSAIRELMKKELEVVVVQTVEKIVKPILEDLIRKVVKEELVSAKEKFMTCDRTLMESRSLRLKFLDEVSLPVLTGKEIKPKEGPAMRLAIVDNSGKLVNSGPAASSKVEVLVLLVNNDENDANLSAEDFNDRIIKENDKKKPHFSKCNYVYLKEGVGFLNNVKLGHGSSWMKSCMCRLGARVADNLNWSMVKEAWTKPFLVQDSRSKLYEKHYPPSLDDEVWRLEYIGKGGVPCNRLYKKHIFTVQDFLFLLSVDPDRLKKMINSGSKMWKTIVDHAQTCIIDDKKIYSYGFPSEKFYVAFDAVARLRGIIRDSHYVPIDDLSDVEKARARHLILHAFENRKDITPMVDEKSDLDQFPRTQGGDLTIPECTDDDSLSEPSTSSQIIGLLGQSSDFGLHGSEITEHLGEQNQVVLDDDLSLSMNGISSGLGSSCPFNDLYSLFGSFGDNENVMSQIFPHDNNLSETESCSYQRNKAGSIRLFAAVAVTLWMSRIRRRITGSGDDHMRKRQRSS